MCDRLCGKIEHTHPHTWAIWTQADECQRIFFLNQMCIRREQQQKNKINIHTASHINVQPQKPQLSAIRSFSFSLVLAIYHNKKNQSRCYRTKKWRKLRADFLCVLIWLHLNGWFIVSHLLFSSRFNQKICSLYHSKTMFKIPFGCVENAAELHSTINRKNFVMKNVHTRRAPSR